MLEEHTIQALGSAKSPNQTTAVQKSQIKQRSIYTDLSQQNDFSRKQKSIQTKNVSVSDAGGAHITPITQTVMPRGDKSKHRNENEK